MNRRLGWTALGLALTLVACGGGSNTPPGAGSRAGLIIYHNSSNNPGVSGGFFHALKQPSTVTPDPSLLDTCQFGDASSAGLTPYILELYTAGGNLSVGSALSLKHNGAVFASLPQSFPDPNDSTLVSYVTQLNLVGFTGVTVSAPGSADFPAFTDVALPLPAQPFTLTSPANVRAVTPTTSFTWTNASNDPAGFVLLAVRQSSPPVSFVCLARDDGSFTIPAAFQTLLASQNLSQGQVAAYQQDVQSTAVGDARLYTGWLSDYP